MRWRELIEAEYSFAPPGKLENGRASHRPQAEDTNSKLGTHKAGISACDSAAEYSLHEGAFGLQNQLQFPAVEKDTAAGL